MSSRPVEELSREECLALFAQVSVARIGITSAALPVVLPVNVVLATLNPERGQEVMIRSVEGTKLMAALQQAVVAIEADNIESISHSGWSVLVRGMARVVEDPDELAEANHLPLRPWAIDDADRFIAVSTDIVTGRRIVPWERSDLELNAQR